MRIRNADNLTFVFEDEDVGNIPVRTELGMLRAPDAEEHPDSRLIQFRKRQVVARRIADHAREAPRVAAAINRRAHRHRGRCVQRHARHVVLEDECLSIRWVALAVDPAIARAQIAVVDVGR